MAAHSLDGVSLVGRTSDEDSPERIMVRAITTDVMLSAWEQAYGLGIVAKGLALLALAQPQVPVARLLEWPIGARDAALLALRAQLFGQEVKSLVACPRCNVQVELEFRVDNILVGSPPCAVEFEVACGDRQLALRSPNSADLLAMEELTTHQERRREMLRRCLRTTDTNVAAADLSEAEIESLAQRIVDNDPQADVRLALDCAACGHVWSARFDIVTYLWRELDCWAQRLLAEVHLLASTYGWSEREITALSPWRRQIYLEMLRR